MSEKKQKLGVTIAADIILVLAAALVMFFAGSKAYTFGHSIFDEQPVDTVENARETEVTIPENVSAGQLAKIMYEKGLTNDQNIFYFQVKLSEYDGKFVAGTYTLNTSMKPTEIMKTLAAKGKNKV